jgi:CheY-like chemotaxis protein
MTKTPLLLVDDEIEALYMQYYIEALENYGFEVTKCASVDEGRRLLDGPQHFTAIWIDVVMPPGEWFRDKETKDGLLTGKFFAENVRLIRPGARLFFLTNALDLSLLSALQRLGSVYQKLDYPPDDLAAQVAELVKQGEHNETQ